MTDSASDGALRTRPRVVRGEVDSQVWPVIAVGLIAVISLLILARIGSAPFAATATCAVAVALATVAAAASIRLRPVAVDDSAATEVEQASPFITMLEHLLDPVLLISGQVEDDLGDRRFLFANAAARDLLRLQRGEGPLTTAIRSPEVLAAIDGALFGRVTTRADWESRGALEHFWQTRVAPLPSSETSPGVLLALVTFHDETEVRRSESTRADFLANASHELRTPLASLTGFIETLRGHAKDDPVARDRFLAIMDAQAARMRHLIDDLMSLSRIELSEHIRPAGRLDLALAVTDVIDALKPQADEREVTFELKLPSDGANAVGDREQIVQVAQNLIENAVKYTKAGGAIAIEVISHMDARAAAAPLSVGKASLSLLTPDRAADQRYAVLRVQDHGVGIARNHLPRLTERFYRVEGQKARERPGTGLGLAIVKHIVNRHRGGMTVESAPGEGSTFTIYLPMPPEAPSDPRVEERTAALT